MLYNHKGVKLCEGEVGVDFKDFVVYRAPKELSTALSLYWVLGALNIYTLNLPQIIIK